jgi:hypothetical protein
MEASERLMALAEEAWIETQADHRTVG